MSYYKVTSHCYGEDHTVIIEAEDLHQAYDNAMGVLTYPHLDLVGTPDEVTEMPTDIVVVPALEGEEYEYDHIHNTVADMEQVMAEVKAAVAAKNKKSI